MASNSANAAFTRDNLFNLEGRVALVTGKPGALLTLGRIAAVWAMSRR